MNNREKILKILHTQKQIKAPELARLLRISRQKTTKHLSELVKKGILEKRGSTRNSQYLIPLKKIKKPLKETSVNLIKNIQGLYEDKVFTEIEARLNLKKWPTNVQTIIFYAFCEMLNNAIDHSQSQKVYIEVFANLSGLRFKVKDLGIGIFANIMNQFSLDDEYQALEHLLKGKQTTLPERHSGQGIFFTSKIADIFKIRSHKIEMTKDNLTQDLLVKTIRHTRGTEIYFEIKKRSRKILRDLFVRYTNEEFEFDHTNINVKLTAERELLARSQARRILIGLEKYNTITLDFDSVKEVGQGFVDEIFRVYQERFPQVQIHYINANPAVKFMILRDKKNLK